MTELQERALERAEEWAEALGVEVGQKLAQFNAHEYADQGPVARQQQEYWQLVADLLLKWK